MLRIFVLVACVALAPTVALAQQPSPEASAPEALSETDAAAAEAAAFAAAREEFEKTITHRTGAVEVASGAVVLTVPTSYYYLDRTDARKVLEDLWGNPPDADIEGMLFQEKLSAFDPHAWGVVITYNASGYVSDEDAAKIDYDQLLRDMQAGQKELNPELIRQNYPPIQLVGWAAPPRYDARAHKIYWAKDLIFGNEPDHTLNYNMRVLGRRGVLELNFVAGMDSLKLVEAASPDVLAMPAFKQGYRYEDFDPKLDKKADYGLAGLVAGGAAGGLLLAKKTGLLTVGLVLLKKLWYLIAIGALAVFGFVRRLFTGKAPARTEADRSVPAPPGSLDAQLFGAEPPAADKPPGPTA